MLKKNSSSLIFNIKAVSRILGHTNIFTTMRYAHPDKSLIACTDSLESHSTTVANTVAVLI